MKKRLFIGISALIVLFVGSLLTFQIYELFELGPNPPGEVTDILGDGVAGNGPDWGDIFDEFGLPRDSDADGIPDYKQIFGGYGAVFIADDLAIKGLVDNTVFAESNKNNDLAATWNWDTGNVPAKDDLANVYAYATVNEFDELIIYVGLERLAPEGDSHIDIAFHQSALGLDRNPPCNGDLTGGPEDGSPCEFVGEKQDGDLLVVMDFEKGGKLGTVEVREWWGGEFVLLEDLLSEGCNGDATVCAWNNAFDIPGGDWPSYDRHGNVIETLPPNAFTEIGVNVTRLLGFTPCYTTIQAKSRSSQSFNSELKDFAAETFELCSIEVDKSGDELSKETDTVTYNFTITNTGVAPLYLVSVNDDKLGDITASAAGCESLGPGDSCTFDVEHTIPVGADDPYVNEVTVEYNSSPDFIGTALTATDDHSINLFQPGVEVSLTGTPTLSKAGHDITYTYTITNTSSNDSPALIIDTISDSVFGEGLYDQLDSGEQECIDSIAPGGTCTFDVVYTIQEGDTGPLMNTFAVLYHPDGFPNDITDSSDPFRVDIFIPSVEVTLDVDCPQSKAGDIITYTATVTNTSISSGTIPALVDGSATATYGTPVIGSCSTLEAGDTCSFQWTYTVLETDPDPLVNLLEVHYNPGGFDNDVSDTAAYEVDLVHPSMTVTKTCAPPTAWRGDTITNTVTIANTGDIGLDKIEITDDHQTEPLTGLFPESLDPGQSYTITYTYVVPSTVEHGEQLINTVTATYKVGIDCLPNELTETDTCTVEIVRPPEGCTPGFWKNHPEFWVGVAPDDGFNATFGVTPALSGLSDDVTLMQALDVSGSLLNALNRHAAAALVNAHYEDVTLYFAYTPTEVISMYQSAVTTGDYSTTKDYFQAANEQKCPLGTP